MRKSLAVLSIGILLPFIHVSEEICPLPEDITPCTCVDRGTTSGINIKCKDADVSEIGRVFPKLRGKVITEVLLSGVKNGRLSPVLFWNTHVKELSIYNCDLQGLTEDGDMPAFVGLENSLKKLEVVNSIKAPNQLNNLDLSHLKHLESLTLQSNNIQSDDWCTNGPESLTSLSILKNNGLKLGERAFQNLKNLKSLSISGIWLNAFKRTMLPNPALELASMSIDNSNLSDIPDDSFSGMPALKYLYLRGNSIERLQSSAWSAIWGKVDRLYLDDNPLECDSHMDWAFSVKRPEDLKGTCASPIKWRGWSLKIFIDNS